MGEEELKWRHYKKIRQLARKDLILVHAVQLKQTINVQMSGKMASIGIRDVGHHFRILRENPYEEVEDDENDNYYYFIIMNKSQETTVFHEHQKLTAAIQRPEK